MDFLGPASFAVQHAVFSPSLIRNGRLELILPNRQQYHTKLEQLLNLTSRIKALASTLGQDYFALDVMEPTPAPGEDEYDSASHRDVTPERFSRLEKELVRGKGEMVSSRHTATSPLGMILCACRPSV